LEVLGLINMEDSIQKYDAPWSDNENDEPIEELPVLVDKEGNQIPECVPRPVEDLDVGIVPVDFGALSKLVNFKKAKLVSQRADEKFTYEKTGTDKTGTLNLDSFVEELTKANEELNKMSDIVLKEFTPTQFLELGSISGGTNNN